MDFLAKINKYYLLIKFKTVFVKFKNYGSRKYNKFYKFVEANQPYTCLVFELISKVVLPEI